MMNECVLCVLCALCCNVTETESQNPKRSRSATSSRTQAQVIKNLQYTNCIRITWRAPAHAHTNRQTENDRRRYGGTEGWRDGDWRNWTEARYKEISEAKIVRKWFGTWFSHDRHTCPFLLCVCVCVCASVCPCCRYFCIQATRPLTGKITSEERAARRRCCCCCSGLKRKSSVR